MTISPKKFISNFGSVNRGVEAKEQGITRLVVSDSLKMNIASAHTEHSSPQLLDDDISALSNSTSVPCSQDNSSYIQVVVKKREGKKEGRQRRSSVELHHATSQTSPTRSPHPVSSRHPNHKLTCEDAAAHKSPTRTSAPTENVQPALYVLPHRMLLTSYPPPHQCNCKSTVDVGNSARSSSTFKKTVRKEREQHGGTRESPPQPTDNADYNNHQMAGESKQWLQDTLSRLKMGLHWPESAGPDKMEVYLLDRGSHDYFSTTDRAPLTVADGLVARADAAATRFWAEVFGLPHLVLAFLTAFLLQLLRWVLAGAVRPLLVGTLQTSSDYLLKPALAVLFNALLQPALLLMLNVLASVRDALAPLALSLADFLKPLAGVLAALRLVHVSHTTDNCSKHV